MVVGLLDHLCQQIEITDAQYQMAKASYEEVGSWLAGSSSPYLNEAQIYPQGSIALGTTIKPLTSDEFDVDLVCHLPTLQCGADAHVVKALIGDRLKEHGTYNKGMLEEKQRCWRINYADKFHLDITPSISNPYCYQGGELVPDKRTMYWKPTNPKGYIGTFNQYAAMRPRFHLIQSNFVEARADIAPLPEQTMSKPFLKRIVQLLKRHRNQWLVNVTHSDLAPVSVIITTLAGLAYAKCVTQQVYLDAFDFVTAIIGEMPTFIRIERHSGQQHYIIENETTVGENFADKWNSDNRLAKAFYEWHKDVLASVESLLHIEGIDQFAEVLFNKFGAQKEHVREILTSLSDPIGKARSTGLLVVAPIVGLTASPALGSMVVRSNNFFGR